MADWQELIEQCAKNFGDPPRRFGIFDRKYLPLTEPKWLLKDRGDKLWTLFQAQREVFVNGTVVWAHIVQANNLLFKPGQTSCPAELVLARDPGTPIFPPALGQIARHIFSLKGGSHSDPELQKLGDHLAKEVSREFGLPVPQSICGDLPCMLSTTFFDRRHIPGGYLKSSALPAVALYDGSGLVLPLPGKYWPKSLSQAFQAGFRA